MAYSLTLTTDERRAFDWVGGRYNALDVHIALCHSIPADRSWDDDGDMTFDVPEHVAWEIDRLAAEEDHSWPCFSTELKEKLNRFCQSIV